MIIKVVFRSTLSPFDVEDLSLSSGNVSKATALQRRVSVYSQGTPDTPTFQDASFFVSPTHTPPLASLGWWETEVAVELRTDEKKQGQLSGQRCLLSCTPP